MAPFDGLRPVRSRLLQGREHYEQVISRLRTVSRSVWIATANLKEMMVEGDRATGRRRQYHSVLEVLDDLAGRGVELRLLHAALPSRPFRDTFDRFPRLVSGGLQLRVCPRVHMKTIVVDGAWLYLGSANWTGAGLGAKGDLRRNFELGIVTDDGPTIDSVQELFDRIWRGAECKGCRLRSSCEAPLDLTSGG